MRFPIVVLGLALPLAAVAQQELKGDAARGRALYTGEQRFHNAAPPCGACHAIGGQGAALNASLGPDLSISPAARDADILDSVMADEPYRTMKPLYLKHPIDDQERADVTAWVLQVSGREPARGTGPFALQAALIALLVFALLAGLHPRLSPRQQIEDRARQLRGALR